MNLFFLMLIKKSYNLLLILLLLFITLISFSPVLKAGFVNWDDDKLLTENTLAHTLSWSNTVDIFKTTFLKIYSPLTILSFSIEHHFFKLKAYHYHLNNLLLHLGTSLLIFWFFCQLKLPPMAAFFASLVFAIHPMHVESVAWVAERKDVLYSFFYILSLNVYLKYIDSQKKSTFIGAVILGCLSLLAKPMALSLPLIFWLCDWMKDRSLSKKIFTEKIWIFLYILPITWMSWKEMGRVSFDFNILEEFLKTTWIFIFYIKKFFIPDYYTIFYSLPENPTLGSPQYVIALFILLGLIFLTLKFKYHKIFVFAQLYYVLSIFFVLRRVQLHSPGGELFYSIEDRFMYLPSLGYCLLIGFFIYKILSYFSKTTRLKYILAMITIGLVLTKLSVMTYNQSQVWNNSMSLWNSVLYHHPHSPIAYTNRGIVQPSIKDALADYSKSLELDPLSPETYFNRGMIYKELKQFTPAVADFNKVVDLMTNTKAKSYYQRPELKIMLQQTKEAIKVIEQK